MAKDSKKAQSSKTENTEIDETLVPSAPTREIKEGVLSGTMNAKAMVSSRLTIPRFFCTDQRLIALA